MTSIEEVVVMFKNDGQIFYNGVNLLTNKTVDDYLIFKDQSEIIKDDQIFINPSTMDVYKCYNYYDELNNVKYSKYLIWKQTRSGEWDWFLSDISKKLLTNIKEYIKYNISYNKDDVLEKIKHIMNEYNIPIKTIESILTFANTKL